MNAITPDAASRLAQIGESVAAGRIIPFLGPSVLDASGAACPVPTSPRDLVARLSQKVGVPGRIRNNLWGAAQYIETNRHRNTLVGIMDECFATVPEPTPLHRWLASLDTIPLIVDSWYDGTMIRAFEEANRKDWGVAQGVTRNGEWRDIWHAFFHCDSAPAEADEAGDWTTVLYKPHGGKHPVGNYLISDSDYVEVLTEIDIQTPIPALVKEMRTDRGFLFLGCRFYDQMLRTFARQIIKRSAGPHFAVLPPQEGDGELTKNEEKFLIELNITPIFMPLDEATAALAG